MVSKLSSIYFQTYQMAYDISKAAEKAFQFERGFSQSGINYINQGYWDSQRKGLLAGSLLELDLHRMEKAYYQNHSRDFEITKNISLLEHDPIAFLKLKRQRICQFNLKETDFDYDYPGHYARQIKTVSLTFKAGEGQIVNAVLTQLTHKTVLQPDLKAVKYLIEPKDNPPLSIRSGWKANQQIALSQINSFSGESQGLFELNLNDERYLPFEGTGAISSWKLEFKGKSGSYNLDELTDITVNVKYTAKQGGQEFASAVKGLLKPYSTTRYFDFSFDFASQWNQFLFNSDDELAIFLTRDMFPDISSSKILGLFATYDLYEEGQVSMVLNHNDESLTLKNGQYISTNGLSIGSQEEEWVFKIQGNKDNIKNINLVVMYLAQVS